MYRIIVKENNGRVFIISKVWYLKNPSKHSSWWKRFEDVLKTSSVLVFKTNIFVLVITSSRSYDGDKYIRPGHTSSRCFEDLFKTSSRRLQGIFRTSWQDALKTSSKRLHEDVFKMYHQVKLFVLTRLQDVFETNSTCFWDALFGDEGLMQKQPT